MIFLVDYVYVNKLFYSCWMILKSFILLLQHLYGNLRLRGIDVFLLFCQILSSNILFDIWQICESKWISFCMRMSSLIYGVMWDFRTGQEVCSQLLPNSHWRYWWLLSLIHSFYLIYSFDIWIWAFNLIRHFQISSPIL